MDSLESTKIICTNESLEYRQNLEEKRHIQKTLCFFIFN